MKAGDKPQISKKWWTSEKPAPAATEASES
jgi:hypothetical protein